MVDSRLNDFKLDVGNKLESSNERARSLPLGKFVKGRLLDHSSMPIFKDQRPSLQKRM